MELEVIQYILILLLSEATGDAVTESKLILLTAQHASNQELVIKLYINSYAPRRK